MVPQFDSPNQPAVNYDELDKIYQNQPDSPLYEQMQSERVISPVSEKLFGIADSIAAARKYRLDTQFFTHVDRQNSFVKAVAKKLFNKEIPLLKLEPLTEEKLKRDESAIGATIFGTPRPNEHIEFFNDNRQSWFFYQGLTDTSGNTHSVTLHYEVQPNAVLRISSRPDVRNEHITGQELANFESATSIYHKLVMEKVYSGNTGTNHVFPLRGNDDQTEHRLAA